MACHIHRVKVETVSEQMTLSAAEVKHLHVMRLRTGDSVEVFDGRGEAGEAKVQQIDAFGAALQLISRAESTNATEYPQTVTLAIALLKGDKLSDVVRAATELGVSIIQLLHTRYADVPDIGDNKLSRLRRVAEEAAKQSQRLVIPEVRSPLPLPQFQCSEQAFYAHPGSSHTLLSQVTWQAPLTLISGPEGGFAPEDLEYLNRTAAPITLGPRILRAETAPLALLGALAASGV